MAIALLFWIAFLAVFALSSLRLYQTEGARDRIVYVLYGIGAAVALGTGLYRGATAAIVMVALWIVLPFVVRPLIEHFVGTKTSATGPTVAAAEQAQRMGKLDRGEMSLGDYFKEGQESDAEARQRLQALATRRDIGAVLARYKITQPKFFALREKLIKVREIEWDVLGNARDLERLITMSAGYKSDTEIGNAFRGRKRGA